MAKVTTEFRVVDAVVTDVDKNVAELLDKYFYYTVTTYHAVPYGPKKRKQKIKLIIGRYQGRFILPTGLIPEAIEILKRHQVEVTVTNKYDLLPYKKPQIEGLTFRKDQMRLIREAVKSAWQRGILVAPTGTGKTVLAAGIISAIYPAKIIFLAHTTDLVQQFASELLKWGYSEKDVGVLSGKNYEWKPITCATIQKIARIPEKEWAERFDCILCDESHHVSSLTGQYGNFFKYSSAKMRIGFTATMPEGDEAKMAMKSLIGPVLEEVTMKEAADNNMIVIPKVSFLTYVPPNKDYEIRNYADIYDRMIVRNGRRNGLILDLIEKYTQENKSVLVGVKTIDHLDILVEKAERRGIKLYGAQGKTSKDERLDIINNMKSGKYLACVATKVWSEGVNIPRLAVVINAAAGKSPIENLQRPGRGTRLTEDKTELLFYDFVDPFRYCSEHCLDRMKIYAAQGWQIEVIEPYKSGLLG